MIKRLASLLLLLTFITNAQEIELPNDIEIQDEPIEYHKNTKIEKSREFQAEINEKYTGKDFEYKENKPRKKKPVASSSKSGETIFGLFSLFMTTIFPFLLGGFVIFVILKTVLGIDSRFWRKTTKTAQLSTKLTYEDEDIHELNLDGLLKGALQDKDYRLAIRYYYLSILKKLTHKEIIDYHKDKTNDEYLFEIDNKEVRTQFSYLSYVYSYVWYGEFPLDESSFKIAQNKYQSFLKSMN